MYLSEILSWLKAAEHKRLGTEWFHSHEVLEGGKNQIQSKKIFKQWFPQKPLRKSRKECSGWWKCSTILTHSKCICQISLNKMIFEHSQFRYFAIWKLYLKKLTTTTTKPKGGKNNKNKRTQTIKTQNGNQQQKNIHIVI